MKTVKVHVVCMEKSPDGKKRSAFACTVTAGADLLSALQYSKYPNGEIMCAYAVSSRREAEATADEWNETAQKRGELWDGR